MKHKVSKELKLETGKLSIPLRMKPATNAPSGAIPLRFQFLWGWNEYHGSCRSKHIENELSIPLRMKCNELSVHPEQVMHFQFLWGWNPLPDEIINLTTNDDFQFLWGWNKITITNQRQVRGFQFLWGWNGHGGISRQRKDSLSIPLRMKHDQEFALPSNAFLTFNSFEDET